MDLPRHDLADAALSAATMAGASYADLRIHRITTDIIQLRDAKLETAVLSRELGLAVPTLTRSPSWTLLESGDAVAADAGL